MLIKVLKYTLYITLVISVLLSYFIFWPRTYNVPVLKKRTGTLYWQLQTGSTIAYTLITGRGNKKPTPVIYLHGGPGGAISNRIIKSLSPIADSGYDVYLYDQIGSGQSARLENIREYTAERHVKDLAAIIQQTGAKKAILIGQSWGAILAVLFTAEHAENVEKIIFINPGPIFPVKPSLAKLAAPDSLHLKNPVLTNAMGNAKANNIRTKAMAFIALKFGKKLAKDEEADNFATYLNYEVNKSTVCDTAKAAPPEAGGGFYVSLITFNSLQHIYNPRMALEKSNMPVLVMKGQCDNLPWGYTAEYLQVFSNHQLVVIPGAGHFIELEQPDIYTNTIVHFLH